MSRFAWTTLWAACIAMGGCRSASPMIAVPLDRGREAYYRAPSTEVALAVPVALERAGVNAVSEGPPDNGRKVTFGSRGHAILGTRVHTRTVVERVGEAPYETTRVRVVARAAGQTDLGGRANRATAYVLGALDATLGPTAVLAHEGALLRGTAPDGRRLEGLVESDRGTLMVAPRRSATGGIATPVPLAQLGSPEVFRGSYDHRIEGAVVGLAVGLIFGLSRPDRSDCSSGLGVDVCPVVHAYDVGLAAGIGALFGGLIGRLVETKVWSPISVPSGA